MKRSNRQGLGAYLAVIFILFLTILYLRAAEEQQVAAATALPSQAITYKAPQGDAKEVYLTFDAAMGESHLAEILQVLHSHRAKASFGVIGDWIDLYPEDAQLLRQSGQGVFSHSMHHERYPDMALREAAEDAAASKERIGSFFEVDCRYIRPPYGAYHEPLLQAMEQMGMETLLWSVDAQDWRDDLSVEQITTQVVSSVKPGDIILFQTNCAKTAAALEQILPVLKQMGYQFAEL